MHRDLNPYNVMIAHKDFVKIVDLDFAYPIGSDTRGLYRRSGTLGYMAPEQVKGLVLDERVDVYSFGATVYEALTKENPFRDRSGQDGPPERHVPVRAVLAEDRNLIAHTDASGLDQPNGEVARPDAQLFEGQRFPLVRPDDFQAYLVRRLNVVKGLVEKVDQVPACHLCLHFFYTSCQSIQGTRSSVDPASPLLCRDLIFAIL